MSFISYAQNFEDVMLWRALKHIKNGFYVDVGAQHPVIDSVSKAFYEHGWRGIHIEPVAEYAELLRKDRPDETVLQAALADAAGTLELNVIADTGLSTAVDACAQRHKIERGLECRQIRVPVLTLKSALQSLAGRDIHWLKIDVEGLEEKVLRGWDSNVLRPWVMVVEATLPNSSETDCAGWDPILIAADYRFVYFDGLNRFYVAKEHAELAKAFSCPPNVFDDIEMGVASSTLFRGLRESYEARAGSLQIELGLERQRAGSLQIELGSERQRAGSLQIELGSERQRAGSLQIELDSAYASKSWRITRPLREAMQTAKRMAKPLVAWAMRRTLARPRLKACVSAGLSHSPELKQRLRQFAERSGLTAATAPPLNTPEELTKNLSPRAARIYAELQKALAAKKS